MDEKEDIRFSAVRILESIGGEEAMAVLKAYIERGTRQGEMGDEDLRSEAAEASKRMAKCSHEEKATKGFAASADHTERGAPNGCTRFGRSGSQAPDAM